MEREQGRENSTRECHGQTRGPAAAVVVYIFYLRVRCEKGKEGIFGRKNRNKICAFFLRRPGRGSCCYSFRTGFFFFTSIIFWEPCTRFLRTHYYTFVLYYMFIIFFSRRAQTLSSPPLILLWLVTKKWPHAATVLSLLRRGRRLGQPPPPPSRDTLYAVIGTRTPRRVDNYSRVFCFRTRNQLSLNIL
jgi:hypothetical protein